MSIGTLVKVIFRLKKDKEGYPPFTTEKVWGALTSEQTCIIDNIPFYVYGISLSDEVFIKEEQGEFFFNSIARPSENSTLRLYCKGKERHTIKRNLEQLGCKIEVSNIPSLFAINVPSHVPLKQVELIIKSMQNENSELEYEFGCLRQPQ